MTVVNVYPVRPSSGLLPAPIMAMGYRLLAVHVLPQFESCPGHTPNSTEP